MPNRISLNVSWPPELQGFVHARVESGRYRSASEVVRAGLRLLEERELYWDDVRAKVSEGLEQARRGDTIPGGQAFRQIRARTAKRSKGRRRTG